MRRTVRWIIRVIPAGILALLLIGIALVALVRIERTVEAGGEILVERYQVVRAPIPGRVESLRVGPGDRVQSGAVLARLFDPDLERQQMSLEREIVLLRSEIERLQVEHAILAEDIHPVEMIEQRFRQELSDFEEQLGSARIAEARLQQQTAEERYQRAQKLSELGLLSEQELREAEQETLLVQQRVAQRQLEKLMTKTRTTELGNSRDLLAAQQKRQIRALEHGLKENEAVLQKRLAELGRLEHASELQILRATMTGVVVAPPSSELLGRQLAVGEELLTIADVESILFETEVPEQAIVRVRTGQKVYVEIVGLPKHQFKVFTGHVEAVAQRAAFDQAKQSSLYPVRIQLDEPWIVLGQDRFLLRHGMRGMAKISYRQNLPILTALYEFLVGAPALPDAAGDLITAAVSQ